MEKTPSVMMISCREIRVLQQDSLAILYVFMFENFDRGLGKARAVNDGRMVQLVGNNQIFFAENGGDRACIRGEAGLKNYASFDILEFAICSSSCMCIASFRRWCARRRLRLQAFSRLRGSFSQTLVRRKAR